MSRASNGGNRGNGCNGNHANCGNCGNRGNRGIHGNADIPDAAQPAHRQRPFPPYRPSAYRAAASPSDSAPVSIRLDAHTASRLNQLRATNFSPR